MRKKAYLKIKRSDKGSGLGLFTEKPIKRGDFVIRYTGEKISDEEADKRGGKYLFTINKELVIDAKNRKNIARYINHSCRPNCYAEIDEENERIDIYAKKKIEEGEEITYNYGKEYWEDHIGPRKCRCQKCKEKRSRK